MLLWGSTISGCLTFTLEVLRVKYGSYFHVRMDWTSSLYRVQNCMLWKSSDHNVTSWLHREREDETRSGRERWWWYRTCTGQSFETKPEHLNDISKCQDMSAPRIYTVFSTAQFFLLLFTSFCCTVLWLEGQQVACSVGCVPWIPLCNEFVIHCTWRAAQFHPTLIFWHTGLLVIVFFSAVFFFR